MALKISKNSGLTDVVSTNGAQTNPLTTQHPITGGSQVVQLWLFNDSAANYYNNVNIDPSDSVSTDESTWVQLSADGVTYQAAGAALSFADGTFGSAGSPNTAGHTFYAKVTSPSGQSVQNKTDIKLTVSYREYAV